MATWGFFISEFFRCLGVATWPCLDTGRGEEISRITSLQCKVPGYPFNFRNREDVRLTLREKWHKTVYCTTTFWIKNTPFPAVALWSHPKTYGTGKIIPSVYKHIIESLPNQDDYQWSPKKTAISYPHIRITLFCLYLLIRLKTYCNHFSYGTSGIWKPNSWHLPNMTDTLSRCLWR